VRAVNGAGLYKKNPKSNDFAVYYNAGEAVLKEKNPYEVKTQDERRYLYPPTFALLFAPAVACGFKLAFFVYLILQVFCLFILFRVSFITAGFAKYLWRFDGSPPILFLTVVFLWRAFDSDFANGQINTLVTALAVLGVFLSLVKKNAILGALLLSLSISFKLYTAPLVLLFLRQGGLRPFLWTVAGIGIFILILPSAFLGVGTNIWYLGTFNDILLSHYTRGGAPEIFKASGQSLWAMFQRFLTRTDAIPHLDEPFFLNFANLPPSVVWVIYIICVVVILSSLTVVQGKKPLSVSIGMFCCAVVLVAPLARKAYFVILAPSFVVALWILISSRILFKSLEPKGRRYRIGLAFFILAFGLMVFTGREIVGKKVSDLMIGLSCFGLSAIGLLISLVLLSSLIEQGGGVTEPKDERESKKGD
jgi:hypothetical protein